MAEGCTSKRTEGGLETLSLRQYCLSMVVGVAAAREMDNLRGMRLGVLGLGLREYLQSVCVGILPEDRLTSLDQWEVLGASLKCCQRDSSKVSSRHTRGR